MAVTTIRTKIILRNDTANNWEAVASTAVLKKGEPAVEFFTDGSFRIKVGDGTTTYANLPYIASTRGDIEGDISTLQTKIDNILNGTAIVGKATADADGNVISTTYAKQTDFNTAKTKLDTIEENAQVNKLEGVKVNGTELQIDAAKKVNIDLSNYATKQDVNSIPKFAIKVVASFDALPTGDEISTTTIYLVPHSHGTDDTYDEYIYSNNKWEKIGNTDVDLSAYSTTEQMNTALAGKADAQNLTNLQNYVGSDDTSGLSKRVKNLEDTKQTADQVNTLIQAATINGTKVNGVVAEAAKVTNKLTAGSKTFDGSANVEITAKDLGALTEITKATSTAIGGILVGYTDNGNNKAVKLDEKGNAYVTVPAYTPGDGLALTNGQFSVKTDGILTAMIKDGQVTDAKIASVNVNKLTQTDGDTLILDGGVASSN